MDAESTTPEPSAPEPSSTAALAESLGIDDFEPTAEEAAPRRPAPDPAPAAPDGDEPEREPVAEEAAGEPEAEGDQEPVDTGAIARDNWARRQAEKAKELQQLRAFKAHQETEDQRLAYMREMVNELKAHQGQPAKTADEVEAERLAGLKLSEDPDAKFDHAQKETRAYVQSLEGRLQQLEGAYSQAQQQTAQQQAEQQQATAKLRTRAAEGQAWNEDTGGGFFGPRDPQTGELQQPGVYEWWVAENAQRMSSTGFTQQAIQEELEHKIGLFEATAKAKGESWCDLLERDARSMMPADYWNGNGSASPAAGPAPAPTPAARPGPAAESVAAANAARAAGLAGTIADGAQGGGGDLPKTQRQMRQAGISARDATLAILERFNGDVNAASRFIGSDDFLAG